MQSILQKLYKSNSESLANDIRDLYDDEHFGIVNFIYFSNIVGHRLFELHDKTINQKNYKKILLKSDFLLPDGIALQVFYFFAKIFQNIKSENYWLPNLNGTDFIPYFLDFTKSKYGNQKICLLLYGTKPDLLQQTKEYFQFKGYNVIYSQDGYSEFDWHQASDALSDYSDTINILLQARSTTQMPIQELWTGNNYSQIKKNKLLLFNVGGLFDFLVGVQKRAPKIIRYLKLERLYRLITDPKRNIVKVEQSLSIFTYIYRYLLLKKR